MGCKGVNGVCVHVGPCKADTLPTFPSGQIPSDHPHEQIRNVAETVPLW
jgi:hypothetical protein